MTTQNIEVLLEKLRQNHELTQQIRADVKEGFKSLDTRVTLNSDNIKELQWQRKNDERLIDEAAEEAKRIIAKAASEAISVKQPEIGSNKWLLATLVTIILALIAAGATIK